MKSLYLSVLIAAPADTAHHIRKHFQCWSCSIVVECPGNMNVSGATRSSSQTQNPAASVHDVHMKLLLAVARPPEDSNVGRVDMTEWEYNLG